MIVATTPTAEASCTISIVPPKGAYSYCHPLRGVKVAPEATLCVHVRFAMLSLKSLRVSAGSNATF